MPRGMPWTRAGHPARQRRGRRLNPSSAMLQRHDLEHRREDCRARIVRSGLVEGCAQRAPRKDKPEEMPPAEPAAALSYQAWMRPAMRASLA